MSARSFRRFNKVRRHIRPTDPVTDLAKDVKALSGTTERILTSLTEPAVEEPPVTPSSKRWELRDWFTIIGIFISLVAVAVTYFGFLATRESISKEQISQDFGLSGYVQFQTKVEEEPDGTLAITDRAVITTAVLTNTGRLPTTVVGFVSTIDHTVPANDLLWVRMDDESSTVHSGPFRLDVGDAIAVRVVTPGNMFGKPLAMRKSSGEVVVAEIIGEEGDPQPSVEEKFNALDTAGESSE